MRALKDASANPLRIEALAFLQLALSTPPGCSVHFVAVAVQIQALPSLTLQRLLAEAAAPPRRPRCPS